MSRGFVKEGDQEEAPFIPPRASLPPGVTNYVTPNGYDELVREKEELEAELKNFPKDDEREKRRMSMLIDGKLNLLNERINTARIMDLKGQTLDEVRFGCIVEFFNGTTKVKFQIVGVDEADVKKMKIAFTAPIARALIGKKVGEEADFNRGNEVMKLKILKILE